MRAYTIFLFLLLFGLCTSTLDSLQIGNQNIGFTEQSTQVTEITENMTRIQEETMAEENWVIYFIKITYSITIIILKALVFSVTCIPLMAKYGIPWEIIAIFQTMQTVVLGFGIAQWVTQRSLKQTE